MATEGKSNKTGTTKRGRKKGGSIQGGSPITIGGGAGIVGENLFIKFIPEDWDVAVGKLTLKDRTKGIISVEIVSGSLALDLAIPEPPKIEILYDVP